MFGAAPKSEISKNSLYLRSKYGRTYEW
jgi:hypothetical protein